MDPESEKQFAEAIRQITEYREIAVTENITKIRRGLKRATRCKIAPPPSQINPIQVEKTKEALGRWEHNHIEPPNWSALSKDLKATKHIKTSQEYNLYKHL